MDGLSDFLLALYRLSQDCRADEFQTRAMSLLQTRVAFDTGRWTHGTHRLNGERTLHENHMQNEPPELLQAYMQVAGRDHPMLALLRPDSPSLATHSYRSRSHWEHRNNGAMRDYQMRFAHENVLMAVGKTVLGTHVEFRHMALYRADPECEYCERDDSIMLSLLPHMLQAQTINRVTNLAAYAQAGEDDPHGFGIADLSGKLHLCDGALRALFREFWPEYRSGHIPAALWTGIESDGRFRDHRISADAWRAHGMVVLRARRRCAADALTARERQVGNLVAGGQTHKQIARGLGITPATARNYIQRLQEKLGVHGKVGIAAELAQAAARSPPIARQQAEHTFVLTPPS